MGVFLVATDGSSAAQAAVAVACELARRTGDSLVLTAVWRQRGGDLGVGEALFENDTRDPEQEWAEQALAAARELAAAESVEAEPVLLHGKPAAEICRLAREREARMVVLGSHGWAPVEGVLLGSVSTGVLSHTPCSVLVVPATGTDAAA